MRHYPTSSRRHVIVAGAFLALTIPAGAQTAPGDSPWSAPVASDGVQVSLIQQDESDCTNTTVKNDPNRTRGGEIFVTKQESSVDIQIGLTAEPNTTYHVFLKCVTQIGDLVTGDEGAGVATFSIATPTSPFAFDIYPDGAPSGNKFQSMTVTLP
jgi:hypothetical protein